MKKLRNKVFWTIFGIMTGTIFIVVFIYNLQNYLHIHDYVSKNMNAAFIDPRYIDFIYQGFVNNVQLSIIVFLFFAVVFFIIAKFLTNWIVKPAEEAFFKQKEFIADASHELKTPLAVIMASSDVLLDNPSEKKWIKNIQEESSRMNNLISKLLELASTERIDKSNYRLGNLSKTIELASLTFEGRAVEKGCNIDLEIQPDIKFNYDENEIKQVVEILLDNATKHSIANCNIYLKLKKDNSKNIELTVQNYGEDIPEGDEEKIFERFYRSDKTRDTKEKRYGLGLAIAKNIVTNHKGKISAKSNDGLTTFKIVFIFKK